MIISTFSLILRDFPTRLLKFLAISAKIGVNPSFYSYSYHNRAISQCVCVLKFEDPFDTSADLTPSRHVTAEHTTSAWVPTICGTFYDNLYLILPSIRCINWLPNDVILLQYVLTVVHTRSVFRPPMFLILWLTMQPFPFCEDKIYLCRQFASDPSNSIPQQTHLQKRNRKRRFRIQLFQKIKLPQRLRR